MSLQPPPHNLEFEQMLLSCIMVDPNMYADITGIVTADSFYRTHHQQTYRAISCLVAEDKPVTVITVADEMGRQGVKDVRRSELLGISGLLPTGQQAVYYARLVAELYSRRQASNSMYMGIEAIQDPGRDIQEVVATVQNELDQALPMDVKEKDSSVFPAIIDVWEKILQGSQGGEKSYIETGFYDLDEAVILANGTLTIVGAYPRVGKTSWILCAMRNIVAQGKRPVLFTLEMTYDRILENIIAQSMQVSHGDMIKGRLSEVKQTEITRRVAEWKGLRMGVIGGSWTANEIARRVGQERRGYGADIVFIDVLTRMLPPQGSGGEKTSAIYDMNCAILSAMSEDYNIPVVLAHHLNRDGAREGRKPTLFSLMEGGEKFTDNVILAHREYLVNPTFENKNIAEFIIAKSRDTDVNTVELGWDGPTKSFYNMNKKHEPTTSRGAYQ